MVSAMLIKIGHKTVIVKLLRLPQQKYSTNITTYSNIARMHENFIRLLLIKKNKQ